MPRLTKRAIDEAKPGPKSFYLWDAEVPGFGLIVLPSGVKSFILNYRNKHGRPRRMTLGRFGVLTVDEARARARAEAVKVTAGEDPMERRAADRAAETMAELLDRYISEHVEKHNAASTVKDVKALIRTHLKPKIGAVMVKAFASQDAARLHHAMRETPRRANYALAILSTALNLAETWGLRDRNSNPCGDIKRHPETHRKRFLTAAEVERLGEALALAEGEGLPWRTKAEGAMAKHLPKDHNRRTPLSWQAVGGVRLLLLTGARLSEALGLRWADVDFTAGTIAIPVVKGGPREPHPVSAATLAVLTALPRVKGSPFVLPSPTDPKKQLSKEVMEAAWQRLRWHCGMEDVRLHDLRHTVGTYAAQAGVSSFIVRDLLRHRNIATTGRYANFDANPVRDVANTVGERIAAGLKGAKPADVVKLAPRGRSARRKG